MAAPFVSVTLGIEVLQLLPRATQECLSVGGGFRKTSRIASKLIVINLVADDLVDRRVGLLEGFPLKSTKMRLCSAMAFRNCLIYRGRWCRGDITSKATMINNPALISTPCGFGPCIHHARR